MHRLHVVVFMLNDLHHNWIKTQPATSTSENEASAEIPKLL